MLENAIKYLDERNLLDDVWTIKGDTAMLEYCHIGLPRSLDIILHPEMLGGRMQLTIAYFGEDAADNRVCTATFEFTDDEENSITEFVADSINSLLEHAEEVFMRD